MNSTEAHAITTTDATRTRNTRGVSGNRPQANRTTVATCSCGIVTRTDWTPALLRQLVRTGQSQADYISRVQAMHHRVTAGAVL